MFEVDNPTIDYKTRPHDALTWAIISASIEVHKVLGPGLLESVYEACLLFELRQVNLKVASQKIIPVEYKNMTIDCGYRIDLLVEEAVVVEVKSVRELEKIHEAQLMTYLKLSDCHVGLLINFNVHRLKEGIRRFII